VIGDQFPGDCGSSLLLYELDLENAIFDGGYWGKAPRRQTLSLSKKLTFLPRAFLHREKSLTAPPKKLRKACQAF
jgi:hypothetical protein